MIATELTIIPSKTPGEPTIIPTKSSGCLLQNGTRIPLNTFAGIDCATAYFCNKNANLIYYDCAVLIGLIWNNDINGCTCPDENHCPQHIPYAQNYPNGPCSTKATSDNF